MVGEVVRTATKLRSGHCLVRCLAPAARVISSAGGGRPEGGRGGAAAGGAERGGAAVPRPERAVPPDQRGESPAVQHGAGAGCGWAVRAGLCASVAGWAQRSLCSRFCCSACRTWRAFLTPALPMPPLLPHPRTCEATSACSAECGPAGARGTAPPAWWRCGGRCEMAGLACMPLTRRQHGTPRSQLVMHVVLESSHPTPSSSLLPHRRGRRAPSTCSARSTASGTTSASTACLARAAPRTTCTRRRSPSSAPFWTVGGGWV